MDSDGALSTPLCMQMLPNQLLFFFFAVLINVSIRRNDTDAVIAQR